jgi:hypothetical protein
MAAALANMATNEDLDAAVLRHCKIRIGDMEGRRDWRRKLQRAFYYQQAIRSKEQSPQAQRGVRRLVHVTRHPEAQPPSTAAGVDLGMPSRALRLTGQARVVRPFYPATATPLPPAIAFLSVFL